MFNVHHEENINTQNVRNNIKDSYDSIKAFLLSSPGEIINNQSYDGRWGSLDEEFKEQIKPLIESILAPKNLVKKKIFGKEITAKELLNYVISIFKGFNDLAMPERLFDSFYKMELAELSEKAVKEFTKKMTHLTDYKNQNFANKLLSDYNRVKLEVLENFKKTPKMADVELEKEFIKITNDFIDVEFSKWKIVYETLNTAHKNHLAQIQWQLLQQRRAAARANYERSSAYQSCRFFTMYMHDCGMTHNVNSVT